MFIFTAEGDRPIRDEASFREHLHVLMERLLIPQELVPPRDSG